MSDEETRLKVSEKRKKRFRNPVAQEMLDRKGPYKMKIIDDKRKYEYKREKISIHDVVDTEE